MYMTYTTTYLLGIGHCGVLVKRGLRWEGVGMSDIVEIAEMGNVFGGCGEIPTVCGQKRVINILTVKGK